MDAGSEELGQSGSDVLKKAAEQYVHEALVRQGEGECSKTSST